MTLLLIGARSAAEATLAAEAGADIVLLKEPGEGLPGALKRAAIRQAITAVGSRAEIWAGVGDVAMEPEALLRVTEAIAGSGVARVMIPLHGERAAECAAALAGLAGRSRVRLMAVVFADMPFDQELIGVLGRAGFAGLMLDVMDKEQGRGLTSLMTREQLARLVGRTRTAGLDCVLAGRLLAEDIPALQELAPLALAFRAAACVNGDPTAPLMAARIRELARRMGRHVPHAASTAVQGQMPATAAEDVDSGAEPDRVFVRGLELDARIGVHHAERDDAQRVRIDVEAELLPRGRGESIGRTICYDYIIDGIRDILARGHINLVETLAEEIARHVLRHDLACGVKVRVEKLERLPGARLGVEISRRRKHVGAAAVIPMPSHTKLRKG